MLTPEQALATYAARVEADAIAGPAQEAVGRLLLDAIACIVAALRNADCQAIAEAYTQRGGTPECTITGQRQRLPAASAAIVHGANAHWYEWDDVFDPGAVHASAVIVPALLAGAEGAGHDTGSESGPAFVTAATVAYDVACRIGEMLMPSMHDGWTGTGVAGTVGAAAGVARLYGLDAAGILSAMGLAATMGATTRQPIRDKVNAKNIMAGLSAAKAVEAAGFARIGVTGPPNFLFGAYGLDTLYGNGHGDADLIASGLGERHAAREVSLKPYPSCRSTHGGVDMALDLLAREPDVQGNVEGATLCLSKVMYDLVGAPFRLGSDPRVSAQFSVAYNVALALVAGAVGIDDFAAARVARRADVIALAERITSSAERPSGIPADDVFAQIMSVQLANGETRSCETSVLRGMPERPLSTAEQHAKLQDAVGPFLSDPEVASLEEAALDVASRGLAGVLAALRSARA